MPLLLPADERLSQGTEIYVLVAAYITVQVLYQDRKVAHFIIAFLISLVLINSTMDSLFALFLKDPFLK